MLYQKIVKKEPLLKGWSGDKKYKVTTDEGQTFLLRVSPKERFENRKKLYEMQKAVGELEVPICHAVEFGLCDEGVYSLLEWIDGDDAETVIPTLPLSKQYELGLRAGEIVRKIHSIPAPDGIPDWGEKMGKKIDAKIKLYEDCPLKFEGGEYMLDYIAKNRHLIVGRPQCFQHGDYHIGNMMISDGELYIIDFDRYDYGDPWEEFNRVWSAEAAPEFARGTVDGYFEDEEIPEEFWKLILVYICRNMLSSLPWAIPFGKGEVEVMRNQAKNILSWYDDMKTVIPSWYRKD